mmetsp:Transcript_60531/g.89802  ORF Transcript_60531/g.89802 Transcript_60531/m.89802 type:complete len:434 (-) Transcript_60531:103-1404(-)
MIQGMNCLIFVTVCVIVIGIIGYITISDDVRHTIRATDLAFRGNRTALNKNDIQGNDEATTKNKIDIIPTNISATSMSMDDSIKRLFDEKRMELRSEAEEDCFCPNGRKSWIHYTGCQNGAGIADRKNILRYVTWYADELCAKISLTCTPEVWLAEKHGCFAPREARWDSYFTPIRKTSNGTILTARDILHWDINETIFEGLLQVKESTNIAGYEMGRELYAKGIPFVWKFDVNYWKTDLNTPTHRWPHQKLSHREYSLDTCGMIDFDTSEELLNVAELLSQELNIQHSNNFVTLHLRRGDSKKCDTEVKTVIEYLKCSIGDDDIQKVLVLTNGEKQYLRNLQEAFSEAFPQIDMISADQFIESESFLEKLDKSNILSSHIGDAFLKDNCFRFGAERVLVSMSRYHLDRGRNHCEQCDRGGSVSADGFPIIRV